MFRRLLAMISLLACSMVFAPPAQAAPHAVLGFTDNGDQAVLGLDATGSSGVAPLTFQWDTDNDATYERDTGLDGRTVVARPQTSGCTIWNVEVTDATGEVDEGGLQLCVTLPLRSPTPTPTPAPTPTPVPSPAPVSVLSAIDLPKTVRSKRAMTLRFTTTGSCSIRYVLQRRSSGRWIDGRGGSLLARSTVPTARIPAPSRAGKYRVKASCGATQTRTKQFFVRKSA